MPVGLFIAWYARHGESSSIPFQLDSTLPVLAPTQDITVIFTLDENPGA